MKTWEVTLPIVGTAYMTVTAETEEDAIRQALETCTIEDLSEWEAMDAIVKGNVCYAPTREAYAEPVGGDHD